MARQQIKNKKILFTFKISLIVFSFSFLFINFKNALADSECETNCKNSYPDDEDQQNDCIDECKKLEKKAETYQDLIDLKNKQQNTLAAQINLINKEQEKNKVELVATQNDLKGIEEKIKNLEESIDGKNKEIEKNRKILSALMQTYYDYDQQGVLDLVLIDKDFSETLSQGDYTQQSSTKISQVLYIIEKDRNDMQSDQDELLKKKEEVGKLKKQLADKNYALENSEDQKQSLMSKTQGEEEKYKSLLARVEQQKMELFNFSSASNLGEVSASVSSYPKPKDHLASTSWYFSQKDSRWGNKRIGNSTSLMKDYGCAVTSVSMVFRKKSADINPGKMAGQKIFYYDLIKWPSSWSPSISLASSVSHGNISWSTINKEIDKGNPVIVFIKKTSGGGGHYVVVTGRDSKDYIVHDPYFGSNLYLGTSKSLVGKIGKDSGVKVDQMIIYH